MSEKRFYLMRFVRFLCVLALITIICGCGGNNSGNQGGDRFQLDCNRDERGVWFITETDTTPKLAGGPKNAGLYDVFKEMGYAVAVDRLWQAAIYRRTALGRLSEILGPGDNDGNVLTDSGIRIIGYSREELQAGYDSLDADCKNIVDGYAAGFNRRIEEVRNNPALLPAEFAGLGVLPDYWESTDVLAWMSLLMRQFDPEARGVLFGDLVQVKNLQLLGELTAKFGPQIGAGMFMDMRWTNDPEALTYIPSAAGDQAADVFTSEAVVGVPDVRDAVKDYQEQGQIIEENLKRLNALVKMGSYAWVVAGNRTSTGNPIIYSGPQMGFETPSIVCEGSIRAGGLDISGMTVPGIPLIIIGRTPHHAWSMQVGHAHTVDYYLEDLASLTLHRTETIKVKGEEDRQVPVYRTQHGPVVYNDGQGTIISFRYAHWGHEFKAFRAFLNLALAQSMDEFGQAIDQVAVSQHFCYADRDGNIAYWMSGFDPERSNPAAAPFNVWLLPQGGLASMGIPSLEWGDGYRARSTDRNNAQGYYCGWNNKTSADYPNCFNNMSYVFGPFNRAHVIEEYLAAHDKLTFEQIRDLALNIAATDSFGSGGNPWEFVKDDFTAALGANPGAEHQAALDLMADWDGHFVDGGSSQWAAGTARADAWVLMNAWIREVIRLTFQDELGADRYDSENKNVLFQMLLHALAGQNSGIINNYPWFYDSTDPAAPTPQTPAQIIATALDNVLAVLGARPWNVERGTIDFTKAGFGKIHSIPFASRSTYAHAVEYGPDGPVRIESMFPLGESGNIILDANQNPVFDDHFFTMCPCFDLFAPRTFPLFE